MDGEVTVRFILNGITTQLCHTYHHISLQLQIHLHLEIVHGSENDKHAKNYKTEIQ